MTREELVDLARRMLALVEAGTTAIHPDGARRNPIATYADPEQFRLEKERIFAREPQLVCCSGDLPGPGSYRAFDDLGIPILVVRNQDGEVRAFLNSCSHRSARLKEGSGVEESGFVCPYHAWTYDLDGKLKRIFKEASFGAIDKSCYDLVSLPCEEKYGFVYVAPAPDAHFTIDEHLGALGPQLGGFDLGNATFIKTGEFRIETNWKLALDTFCEGYHFAPLHPNTVGLAAVTNCMTYDSYGADGEHHRLGFPNKSITELSDKDESEWGDVFRHFNFVYYIYPNISLLVSPDAVELFQLYPGDRVGEHVTKYNLYMRQPVDSEERQKGAEMHHQMIYSIVENEDYWVSVNVQKNFNTGLKQYTTFGANEPSLINMHRTFRRKAGLPLVDEPAEV
jgi:phenylpropionate dioxygenase-like ring-hydroxylating dioxygenase large terminal subunit